MIDSKLANSVDDVTNMTFSAPSPVLVRLSPSQGRQDPSMLWPCAGYGNPGGEVEEPVLAELAMSSFLGSLRAAGIAVPQGFSLVDSSVRESSEAALSAAFQAWVSASRSQDGSAHDSGHDAALRSSWFDESVNVGVCSSSAEPASHASVEPAHRISFVEVPSLDNDDHASVVSEKAPPSEGLRLLFQLCPSAAVEAPPQPQRACDFEGLFSAAPKLVAGEVPTILFHRVAELLSPSVRIPGIKGLREVIFGGGAVRGNEGPPLRAHSIPGISTSAVFLQKWSVSKVLEAATEIEFKVCLVLFS